MVSTSIKFQVLLKSQGPSEADEEAPDVENLPPEVAKRVLQRCTSQLVEDMRPDSVCDLMLDHDTLTPVEIRDIREKPNTTEKNRAIIDVMHSYIEKYPDLKTCLLETKQEHLVSILKKTEIEEMAAAAKVVEHKQIKRLSTKVRETKQELLDLYCQNCRSVPVNPEAPEDLLPVSRLYVRPQMKVMQSRKFDDSTAPKRRSSFEGCYVENYEQIFYVEGRLCKNICISGDAGFGKTAFCENLADKWSKVHSRNTGGKRETEASKDEQVMSQFDILFYISLRHATGCRSIEDMIKDQLTDIDEELFETARCLIVLDGLDEWTPPPGQCSSRFVSTGLPKRSKVLVKASTILMTSRPWKLEKLRLRTSEIDNHVKICSLSESATGKLIGNTMAELNSEYEKNCTTADFTTAMKVRNINIFALCPMLLMHIVCVWHDGLTMGNSLCDVVSGMVELLLARGEEKLDEDTEHHAGSDPRRDPRLPACFRERKYCQKYKHLLLIVCKLAFKTLLTGNRETELVFDSSVAKTHGLSQSDIETCLKIGILSQSKGNRIARTKVISFPHKMLQEFLAAVHIVVAQENILSTADVDKILEMSHIILFVVGMLPEFSEKVSQHLLDICDEDERFRTYRSTNSFSLMDSNNYMLICNVQEFLCECQRDLQSQEMKVKIGDVVVDTNTIVSRAKCLLKMDTSHIKSLYIDIPSTCSEHSAQRECVEAVMKHMRNADALQKVFVWDTSSGICKNYISTLLSSKYLCTVGLRDLGLDEKLEFSKLPNRLHGLKSLRLQGIELAHNQICDLFSFLSKASDLNEIILEAIACVDHDKGCAFELDMSGNAKLQYLYLESLCVCEVSFNATSLKCVKIRYLLLEGALRSVIRCLDGCEKLEILDFRGCLDTSDAEMLVQKIARIPTLKIVVLWRTNIYSSGLLLSSLACLELVRLNNVVFTKNSFEKFVENIPNSRNDLKIELEGIHIADNKHEVSIDCIDLSERFRITRSKTVSRSNAFSVTFYVKESESMN